MDEPTPDTWATLVAQVSPGYAQREVRAALRHHRRTANITRADAARRLGWSVGSVLRSEHGGRPLALNDLHTVLTVYGIIGDSTHGDENRRLWAYTKHALTEIGPMPVTPRGYPR